MSRRNLRDEVFALARDACEWPKCPAPAVELAHLHSVGMGGRKSADSLDNVMAACWLHARITDGEGAGFDPFFRQRIDPTALTIRMLQETGYLDKVGGLEARARIAWHRAEALRLFLKKSRDARR